MKHWLFLFILLLAGGAEAKTVHIAKSGSDGNDGLSWGNAKLTWHTGGVAILAGGDTCLFGAGRWDSTRILNPPAGTFSDNTYFIDSLWKATGTWGGATLCIGKIIETWENVTGQIYRAAWDEEGSCSQGWTQAWVAIQDDSLLIPRTSYANITEEGMFHHTGDSMYLWAWGGGDPDGAYTIRSTCQATIEFNDADAYDHVRFEGLNLYLGVPGVVHFESNGADSIQFYNCRIRFGGSLTGENPSIITSQPGSGGNWMEYLGVKICSIGGVYPPTGTPPDFTDITWTQVGGNVFYQTRYAVFDSCVFFDIPGPAIYWKQHIPSDTPWAASNVAKFNRIIGNSGRGITSVGRVGVTIGAGARKDSIYGNVITHQLEAGILVGNSIGPGYNNGRHWIANNTMDSCGTGVKLWKPNQQTDSTSWVKYNIVNRQWPAGEYEIGSAEGEIGFYNANANMEDGFDIDYNMFYDAGDAFRCECDGSTGDSVHWVDDCGFGANSTFLTDPAFNDMNDFDYSRPGASGEIDVTYGGRTWTIFGAIQNEAAAEDSTVVKMDGKSQLSGKANLGD